MEHTTTRFKTLQDRIRFLRHDIRFLRGHQPRDLQLDLADHPAIFDNDLPASASRQAVACHAMDASCCADNNHLMRVMHDRGSDGAFLSKAKAADQPHHDAALATVTSDQRDLGDIAEISGLISPLTG